MATPERTLSQVSRGDEVKLNLRNVRLLEWRPQKWRAGLTTLYYMGVRLPTAILVNLSLVLAFLQAPFLHVHDHESSRHDHHGFFHAHYPHSHLHSSERAGFCAIDSDEDAHYVNWVSSPAQDHSLPALALPYEFSFVPEQHSELRTQLVGQSGRAPPGSRLSIPRAPPA